LSLEAALILIESVLLLATIALLIYSIREGRLRNKLIIEVGKATRTLTRMEYFLAVHDSMMDAKKEVFGCITGRPPEPEDEKRVEDIVSTIKKLVRAGVKVKYLMPKIQDRLYIGHIYSSAGAEIRYSACSMLHNLRYIVVDNHMVVIGVPENIGEQAATNKGHRIPSSALATIVEKHFCDCWGQDITLKHYFQEVLEQTGMSLKQLARELHLNARELEKILAPSSTNK
jgi:hypothetical protein